jgi:hypothetical protein
VARLVDETASPHLADLVDADGELVAAVLDMDGRLAVRDVASIDIGDTGHSGGLLEGGGTAFAAAAAA